MAEEHEQRVFNLQIQIQKLEEELSLFRNGASGQELFEVIGEKNTEIHDLKVSLAAKTDSLKKLAKSSGDVLSQYSALQDSFEQMKLAKAEVERRTATLQLEIEELRSSCDNLSKTNAGLKDEGAVKQEKICELERDLIDANVVIDKLHRRGATLVSEKTEKSKALDKARFEKAEMEKTYQVSIFVLFICAKALADYMWYDMAWQIEIAKLEAAVDASKKQVDTEIQEKLKARKQYEDSQQMIQDVRGAIAAAQKANDGAKADMKKIKISYEAKVQVLMDQMEDLQTTKAESEDKLIKVIIAVSMMLTLGGLTLIH